MIQSVTTCHNLKVVPYFGSENDSEPCLRFSKSSSHQLRAQFSEGFFKIQFSSPIPLLIETLPASHFLDRIVCLYLWTRGQRPVEGVHDWQQGHVKPWLKDVFFSKQSLHQGQQKTQEHSKHILCLPQLGALIGEGLLLHLITVTLQYWCEPMIRHDQHILLYNKYAVKQGALAAHP